MNRQSAGSWLAGLGSMRLVVAGLPDLGEVDAQQPTAQGHFLAWLLICLSGSRKGPAAD